jgi:hypothetical protein
MGPNWIIGVDPLGESAHDFFLLLTTCILLQHPDTRYPGVCHSDQPQLQRKWSCECNIFQVESLDAVEATTSVGKFFNIGLEGALDEVT